MTFSQRSRRWITPAVLTGYLLVATLSGLFHQHGEGTCCDAGACAAHGSCDIKSDGGCDGHGRHHHHHGRAVKGNGAKGHGAKSHGANGHGHGSAACRNVRAHDAGGQIAGRRENRPPARAPHEPLRHANCAACRFLAQQSVTTPPIVLERSETFVSREPDDGERLRPTVVVAAHPGRGPPERS